MNRRTSIKILGLGFIGSSVFSMVKWFKIDDMNRSEILNLQKDLIAELAETIIPATDTPGAKDAKVEDFIIKVLVDCEDNRSQNNFIKGLEELQKFSIKNYNTEFQHCSSNNKMLILEHFEKNESIGFIFKVKRKLLGNSFFYQLKTYTTIGFCTSKLGATIALNYDYIPRTYQACILMKDHQKSWATK